MFKVGQEVWCLIFGKGVVYEVNEEGKWMYPVGVRFENVDIVGNPIQTAYTKDGKYHQTAQRTLYFSEPMVVALSEPPFETTLKEGELIAVIKKDDQHKTAIIGEVSVEHVDYVNVKDIVRNGKLQYWSKEEYDFYRLDEPLKF